MTIIHATSEDQEAAAKMTFYVSKRHQHFLLMRRLWRRERVFAQKQISGQISALVGTQPDIYLALGVALSGTLKMC